MTEKEIENVLAENERLKEDAAGYLADYRRIRQAWEEKKAECKTLENKLKAIEEIDSGNAKGKYQIDAGALFTAKVNKFIEDVAGYLWLADEIMELPENNRADFIKSVDRIRDWTTQMIFNIKERMEIEQ